MPKAHRIEVNLEALTLRQFMALLPEPPMYRPQDLVDRSEVPQPRVSELLRGQRIYPAGLEKVRLALGIEDPALLDRLIENSAREVRRP